MEAQLLQLNSRVEELGGRVCPLGVPRHVEDRPSRHWTDRPKRRHHTHQEPGGLSSDADGVPTFCVFESANLKVTCSSNVIGNRNYQEKEMKNEAARGLTAGFGGSGVCVGVRTLSHCQHLHRHPSRRRPNHPQRRQRAHAPCLLWGHVRCVYSERAVTVPHRLSRLSC